MIIIIIVIIKIIYFFYLRISCVCPTSSSTHLALLIIILCEHLLNREEPLPKQCRTRNASYQEWDWFILLTISHSTGMIQQTRAELHINTTNIKKQRMGSLRSSRRCASVLGDARLEAHWWCGYEWVHGTPQVHPGLPSISFAWWWWWGQELDASARIYGGEQPPPVQAGRSLGILCSLLPLSYIYARFAFYSNKLFLSSGGGFASGGLVLCCVVLSCLPFSTPSFLVRRSLQYN